MRVPIDSYRLDNGLLVTLSEDHSAPIVGVNLWYHVGSANEPPGRTGFAHLFEHMLFQGSAHVAANEHFELIARAGGTLNGSTWLDRTNYYETLPSSHLSLALWLEADRMGQLLPAMTQEKLDTQRAVVKDERRWRMDNQPYGTWFEKLPALAFPSGHPFHHSLMGSMEDLDAATLDNVSDFFRTWYTPDNACLTISGDFDPGEARALVMEHFGGIPRGGGRPPLPPMGVTERFGSWRREVVGDEVAVPRLFLAFRSPVLGAAEYAAASVCGAVLGLKRGSRLYRSVVAEREVASEATASTWDLSKGSDILFVDALARPGIGADALESAVVEEVDSLRQVGATAGEVERAIALIETLLIASMQKAEERADALSRFATYFGDAERANEQLDEFRAVTTDAVNAYASRMLGEDNRLSLLYVPREEAA